jgi:signal transduction histidine kinase
MFPISNGDKNIYGLMMEVSDITQMKLLEEKLLAQKVQEQKKIIKAVLNAQEIERNKIGQELHDNVNQILSSIKLYISMLEVDPAIHKDLIARAKEYIDLAITEIRKLSSEQVTPQKKFDLKEMIDGLTLDLNKNTLASTKFHCSVSGILTIDEDLKLNIYRIVQEQVTNILKYAAASTANISIVQNNGFINISIIDNGKGFDPFLTRKGIGISNTINRTESYDGTITIESSPGKGCKINITIPH